MKNLIKFIHLFFSIMIISNIIWVLYHWNTYDHYPFIGFDIPKYYYLPLQGLFAWVFITSYLQARKADG